MCLDNWLRKFYSKNRGVIINKSSFVKSAGYSSILIGISSFVFAYNRSFFVHINPKVALTLNPLITCLVAFLSIVLAVFIYNAFYRKNGGLALLSLFIMLVYGILRLVYNGDFLINEFYSTHIVSRDFLNSINLGGITFIVLDIAWFYLVSKLISKNKIFPQGLKFLGYFIAAVMVAAGLGLLVNMTPSNDTLAFFIWALSFFLMFPVWYIWMGIAILSQKNLR